MPQPGSDYGDDREPNSGFFEPPGQGQSVSPREFLITLRGIETRFQEGQARQGERLGGIATQIELIKVELARISEQAKQTDQSKMVEEHGKQIAEMRRQLDRVTTDLGRVLGCVGIVGAAVLVAVIAPLFIPRPASSQKTTAVPSRTEIAARIVASAQTHTQQQAHR